MTDKYLQAIALFAQRILDSAILAGEESIDQYRDDPWMHLPAKYPGLRRIARSVEDDLGYEMSWNQCCNAINWTFKYSPEEWAHLISE